MKLNEEVTYDLIVVGGGAAGFFGAIEAARLNPALRIIILEKSNKLLAKVKISGGGRCNVTHRCFDPVALSHHYPRGEKLLKKIFKQFHAGDMVGWLMANGVKIQAEADGRMFPVTNNSQTIIDCFLELASRSNIRIELNAGVERFRPDDDRLVFETTGGKTFAASKALVAIGGNPKTSFYNWISAHGHTIHTPVPSLFTFNDAEKNFVDLMGLSVRNATVRIAGTKFLQEGPLLITHWGLSGPAVIKLSAWAAEYLHEVNYRFTVFVNWTGALAEAEVRAILEDYKLQKGKQVVVKNPLFFIPLRLWEKLCHLAEIPDEKKWHELGKRNINKLLENLIRCPFAMQGKTTFKEEFVTCGGVELKDIDPETMESKFVKNLFFAGEVLNIDGETGGFNFQAAWTTAYIAARSIAVA